MNQTTDNKPLPEPWKQWLLDNLRRGCTSEQLTEILHQHDLARCTIALNDRELAVLSGNTTHLRPQPDTTGNCINLDGHTVRIVMVLDQPQVIIYENLLSNDECDALCCLADAALVPATVVDEEDGLFKQHPHRSSEHACFTRAQTALIDTVEKRIARILNWPVENTEGIQVLRYAEGGEYRAHFDYFDPHHAGSAKQMETGGQRVGTMLMYLSDVTAGGGTRFPGLGFEVRPHKGSAIYFASVNAFGEVEPQSLHASVAVVNGVKYAATKWIRETVYT